MNAVAAYLVGVVVTFDLVIDETDWRDGPSIVATATAAILWPLFWVATAVQDVRSQKLQRRALERVARDRRGFN